MILTDSTNPRVLITLPQPLLEGFHDPIFLSSNPSSTVLGFGFQDYSFAFGVLGISSESSGRGSVRTLS